MIYITIDGGTTNTRASLIKNNEIINTLKIPFGAKDGKEILSKEIKACIDKLLCFGSIKEKDIECILASGMLTSELGLYCLNHITTPAGITELHNSMKKVILDDISNIPFVFIPGVKTKCDNLENADMMRGEETELMGILEDENINAVYILPGSHSKIISVDSNQKIVEFKTMLTGEMIAAFSQNTILKNSLDLNNAKINDEYLINGYNYCNNNGINNSAFKVRILKNIFNKNNDELYSFFLGVMLCDEINEIIKQNPQKIIIGGKSQLKTATEIILKNVSNTPVKCIDDNSVEFSTVKGIIKIYEKQ